MLTPEHDQAIRSHGERAFPHECCGFLLGKVVEGVYRVARVMPAANSRGEEEKHNRFTITPEASYLAEKAARKEKLDIIGHYHSHPNHPARPSQYDLDHATWPGSAFAIVSVMKGRAELMTSWLLAADRSRFDPQAIEIEQHQET
ncbi:MAG: hypothetical protein GC162_01180 [Planctomycetes bacterium]|nr:hypothetical protein [Planctomycetota bacterium]